MQVRSYAGILGKAAALCLLKAAELCFSVRDQGLLLYDNALCLKRESIPLEVFVSGGKALVSVPLAML